MESNYISFKSRKGFILPLVTVFFAACTIAAFSDGIGFFNVFLSGGFFLFILLLTLKLEYRITEKELQIKCLFLYNLKIPIENIREVRPSRDLSSSPALSLNRLRIRYNKFDDILISPQNQDQFIAELLARNPNIFYNPKRE
mgnify:FL=1